MTPTRRDVQTLFSITFLSRSTSVIVQTVSPIVLVNIFGTPAGMVGWMIAGFWIANALGTLFAAGVIRNRRYSLLAGFLILFITFLGAALIQSSLGYALCIVLSGFGLSIVQVFLIPTMHQSSTVKRPHMGIANYSTALSLGMIAGPLVAAAAVYVYGFSALFVILAVVSVATLAVVQVFGIQKSFSGEDTRGSLLPSNIFRVLRQKAFGNYPILNSLYSMLLPILLSYGGIYGEGKFHISSTLVLALFATVFTISTFMRMLFTRSEPRHFRILLVTGFSCLFVSFAMIGIAGNFYLFLLGFLLFSIPHALIYPITTFMALESGGKNSIITSTYIFQTSSGLAEFISPLAAIPIITLYSFSWVFLLMMPFSIAGLVLSLAGEVKQTC
ncbi:MAG: MFS transporter [Nitrososphaerota archaeon]|nr:MFS transporter [Nitrososphaerota archaeon]